MGFNSFKGGNFASMWVLGAFIAAVLFSLPAVAAPTAPSFTMQFSPSTIAPGSISTVTFTIANTNSGNEPLSEVGFTATLPTGMTVVSAPNAASTCVDAQITATAGAGSLALAGVRLGAEDTCTYNVNVTSSTVGTHALTTGTLSGSNADGSHTFGTANASLTVNASLPAFTMSLSPSTVAPGGVTTVTYTIDNSLSGANATFIDFSHTFDSSFDFANTVNLSHNCPLRTISTFVLGSVSVNTKSGSRDSISVTVNDAELNAGATCTISVDIKVPNAIGDYNVEAGELTSSAGTSGAASALLTVQSSISAGNIMNAAFASDASPGESIALSFLIANTDRDNDITGLNFTADLNAALSGLTATALPTTGFCGTGSTISGSSSLSVSNVSLASGSTCGFSVTVQVPANAAAGNYSLSTSTINLTRGSATTEAAVSTLLRVRKAPLVSMQFLSSSAAAGDDITLRMTITNTDTTNSATAIGFTVFTADAIPGFVAKTFPNANYCGTGSATSTSADNNGTVVGFTVSGANLTAGANCSFDVVLTVPAGAQPGSYSLSTSTASAEVSGSTLGMNNATAEFSVVAGPVFTMGVREATAQPGSTVNLDFFLELSENATSDATNMGFTVDLNAALAGFAVNTSSLVANGFCGSGSTMSGTNTLTVSGMSLTRGDSCSFSVTATVPTNAAIGTYTLTSSTLTSTISSTNVTSPVAQDNFSVSGLSFSHSFVTNPVLPASSTVIRYTIANNANAAEATAIQFSHSLSGIFSSVSATSLPSNPCGSGSTMTGTANLSFSGGQLSPGASCEFDVTISIPSNATDGLYNSVTSGLSATVNSANVSIPASLATLTVETLTVLISTTAGASTSTSPIPITISFSRNVNGLEANDLTVTNGTASNLSGSDNIYTASITPTTNGNVTVVLPANAVDDAVDATVKNPVSNTLTIAYSSTPSFVIPTLSIGSASATTTTTGPVTYTITYTNADEVNLTQSQVTLNKTSTASATIGVTGTGTSSRTVSLSNITGDGTLGISVAANTARHNSGGSAAAAGPSGTFNVDNTAPTVAISDTVASTVNAPFTATFTFSENVTGFIASDITANNANISNFSSISNSVYTALVTPSSQGAVTIDVAAGVASDAVGNSNTAASQLSVSYDTVAPTVTISGPTTAQNAAFTATVTFSEDVTGFTAADISASNANISNFGATNGAVYTATITPTSQGSVTLDVSASAAQDGAGNNSTAATQYAVTFDSVAPAVTISGPTTIQNSAFTATFTFTEDVTGFEVGDISATNANISNFSATSTSVYTATVTPTSDGSVTLDVAAASAADGAGNSSTAATQYTVNFDGTAPGVTISGPTTVQTTAFTATFTFTEDVTGFTSSDIVAANAGITNFGATSASVYTATVTPTSDGSVTLNVSANSAIDGANNGNTAASQYSVNYDVTAPTVVISGPTAAQNAAFTATVTFSEDVTGFTAADISASNANLSNFGATSGSVYTVNVTPTTQGSVTLDVSASAAQDGAGNNSTAATQYAVTFDSVSPAVTISGPTTIQNSVFTATFTFTEDVTGFSASDISATNASIGNFSATSTSVYTATVTPTSDGSITLDVAAASATDSAGNSSTAATQYTVNFDGTAPGITISGPTMIQNSVFTATFTFTEDVTGFTSSDIVATNAGITNFGATSASVYTATVTPTSDGSVILDVAASSAIDSANNGNTAAGQYSVNYDATAPTVAISGPATAQNAAFTATVTFSEDVTGFVVSDISASGASISNFSAISGAVYNVTVTPTAQGSVTLDVAAGVAQDGANNNNSAATQYSVAFDSISPTLVSSVPQDDANLIALNSDLVLTFSESVQFNPTSSGTIQLIRLSESNTEVETITMTLSSGSLTGQGTGAISGSVLTVNPTANLLAGATYAVRLSSDLLQDSVGNNFAGINSNTALNFDTLPAVQILVDVSQLVEEKEQTATVTVALRSDSATAINSSSDVSVVVSFAGSTATADSDYTVSGLTNNTVTIAAGTSESSFTLTSVNDSPLADEPEQIIVSVESISTNNAVEEQAQQVTINIVENAVPSATNLPSALSIPEDSKTSLALSDVNVADVDGDNVIMVFTMSAGRIVSPLGSANGTTVTQDSAQSLSLSGAAGAIDAFFDNQNAIAVIPPLDDSGPLTLSVTVSDSAETSPVQQIPITISPVNDNPRLLNGNLITFDISQGMVTSATSFTETESGVTMTVNLDSGNLQVADLNTLGGSDGDVLYSSVANGTSLVTVTFSQRVNLESLNYLVNAGSVPNSITFSPTGGTGAAFTVNSAALATDSVGTKIEFSGWTNITGMTISSNDGNFAPGIDNVVTSATLANVTVVEDTLTPLNLSELTVSDVDSSQLLLTISASSGALSLSSTDTSSGAIASLENNIISVAGTASQIDAYLNESGNIEFLPASNVNEASSVTLSLDDNNGSGTVVLQTVIIDITAVNDAPIIDGLNGDIVNFVQAGTAVRIDSGANATVTDVDDTTLAGGTLTVTVSAGGTGSEDLLSFGGNSVSLGGLDSGDEVLVDNVVVGTIGNAIAQGNDIVVALNENATAARVSTLLQAITYFNSNSASLSSANRSITTRVSDGDDVSEAAVSTITFTPLDEDSTFAYSSIFTSITPDADSQITAQTALVIEATDSGTDGLSTTITNLNFTVSGTLDPTNISYILRRVDNSNSLTVATYVGRYSNGVLNFSDLIEIENGSSNTSLYLEVYFNNNSGLVDNSTIGFAINPGSDVSVLSNGSQIGASGAQGPANLSLNVAASELTFVQQPAGSVSGAILTTPPVVIAEDSFGNLDLDFQELVVLNVRGNGAIVGNSVTANAGVATFDSLAYFAAADNESFELIANLGSGSSSLLNSGISDSVVSDVVATNLSFSTQPAPLLVNAGITTRFSAAPVIIASNAQGITDLDYQSNLSLSVANAQGTANLNAPGDLDSLSATVTLPLVQGMVAFDDLDITYQTLGQENETFNLLASSSGLNPATSVQLTATNIPLLEGVPETIIVAEDIPSPLDFTTLIASGSEVGDITLTFSVNSGTLINELGDGIFDEVTVSGSGSGTLTLMGTVNELSNYLSVPDVLSYLTVRNDDTEATLTIASTIGQNNGPVSSVRLSITPVNDAPEISGTPGNSVKVLRNYSFTPTATDIDSQNLSFSIQNAPSWSQFDAESGTLSGQPGAGDTGLYGNIIISVSDGGLSAQLPIFSIEVLVNSPPVITGMPSVIAPVGQAYQFLPQTSDEDNDPVRFIGNNVPGWMNLDTVTGALSGSPTAADVGVFNNIQISVSDGVNTVSLPAFAIRVCEVCDNQPPEISGSPGTTAVAGNAYSFVPRVTDANNDTLTFSIANLPSWSAFDAASGTLSGIPQETDVGTYSNIVISVSDGENRVSLAQFTIQVISANSAPTIAGIPATLVSQGQRYEFSPVAVDAEGDNLVFSIENRPGWMAFNPQSGLLRGTPTADDIATYNGIRISVTDNVNEPVSLPSFNIEVVAQNSAPVISGVPRTSITPGVNYLFQPQASDADNDNLTFSVTNLPAWLTFNTETGQLSGTAAVEDIGTYDAIAIAVTDGNEPVSLPEFSITVTNENNAPVTNNMNLTLPEDSSISISADVTDSNQDDLQLTVLTPPGNGSLEIIDNGWIYTPAADFNGEDAFVYEASDGELTSSQATVSLLVVPENDIPVAVADEIVVNQVESGVYLLDVLANDTDADITTNGDIITLQTVTSNFGISTVVDNQLQLTVDGNFIGSIDFSYSIRDGESASATATGTVTITGVDNVNAPVITVPADVTVDATGLFTRVELGTASAVDASGNVLPVTLVNEENNFTPGHHTVFWQAEDSFGTKSTKPQQVDVNPIVSLAAVDSVAEGTTFNLRFILNGDAPSYPYEVNYAVTGSAEGNGIDYLLDTTTVTFNEGREQNIAVEVLADSTIEADETIEVSLLANQNASNNNSVVVTISENNIAPTVSLVLTQNDSQRTSVARDEGIVSLTAQVSDPNPQDSVAIDWSSEALTNTSVEQTVFQFDPIDLPTGFYTVGVYANDDGNPVLDTTDTITFEVVESFTALSDTLDTDGDLIPDAQEGYGDSDGDGVPDYLDAIDDCNIVAAQAANQTEFLVEVQSGTCMRRGEISSRNDSNGVQVVLDDGPGSRPTRVNKSGERVVMIANELPEDIGFENVGGVYDFVIYDLVEQGQSVFIVIPQVSPIPENAVFRKYNSLTQQWSSFVNDDNNSLFSAPGEQGFCPAPAAEDWQPGLVFGAWCLQLRIQDGGPNDEDNLTDGRITDPGGLAVFLSDNTAPVAQDDQYQMKWNSQLEADVLANDSDADLDDLSIVSASANIGSVEIVQATRLVYTAQEGFSGTDSISYLISDGNAGSDSAVVTLTIVGNRAPGAFDDFAETDNKTAIEIDVLSNDIDVDGDEIVLVSAIAEIGEVSITANGTLLYMPDFNHSGLDSVNYEIADPSGASGNAVVTVFVDGNEAPVAVDDNVTTAFETAVTINVLDNDSDPDNDELLILEATAETGSVVIGDGNSLIYTPANGFSGSDVISYTISDGVLSVSAVVNVTVLPQPIETVEVRNSSSGGVFNPSLVILLLLMWCIRYRERQNGFVSRGIA